MSDILERLQKEGETVETLKAKGHWSSAKILEQAAEIERLRAALRVILDGFGLSPPHYVGAAIDADYLWIVNAARSALGEERT